MKFTIIYDNEAIPPFKGDWGFACLVETSQMTLLFDTGAKSEILLENMKTLNLDPKKIQAIMLSHDHWDHTGGLNGLLTINPNITVYKPTFTNKPTKITSRLKTTGYLISRSGIREQSLLCETKEGQVVITGCSHPGLEKILDIANKFGNILGVLGGFHGFDDFNALKNITVVMPCHCTSYKQEIQKLFPEAYRYGGAGKKLEFGM